MIQGKEKQKLMMEGKIEETRCRGKQRRTWTSVVTDWCVMSCAKCVRNGGKQKELEFHGNQPSSKKMAPTVSEQQQYRTSEQHNIISEKQKYRVS